MGSVNLSGVAGWSLAASAFVGPNSYISGPAGQPDAAGAQGFDISSAAAVTIAFEGTYSGLVLIHEQTLDPAGMGGWFPVMGVQVGNPAVSTVSGVTPGQALTFPVLGQRQRMRVTAFSSGLVVTRLSLVAVPSIVGGAVAPAGGSPAAAARIPTCANTTNPTLAKAGGGRLYTVHCLNTTATVTYLKIYDKATAPVVGTDPPVLTFAIPGNGALAVEFAFGFGVALGLGFGLTTDAADAGATAPAAGAIVGVNVGYA